LYNVIYHRPPIPDEGFRLQATPGCRRQYSRRIYWSKHNSNRRLRLT